MAVVVITPVAVAAALEARAAPTVALAAVMGVVPPLVAVDPSAAVARAGVPAAVLATVAVAIRTVNTPRVTRIALAASLTVTVLMETGPTVTRAAVPAMVMAKLGPPRLTATRTAAVARQVAVPARTKLPLTSAVASGP
jgi:hypothetical protein